MVTMGDDGQKAVRSDEASPVGRSKPVRSPRLHCGDDQVVAVRTGLGRTADRSGSTVKDWYDVVVEVRLDGAESRSGSGLDRPVVRTAVGLVLSHPDDLIPDS